MISIPPWNPSASPGGKSAFIVYIEVSVGLNSIAVDFVFIRHGLGEWSKSKIFYWWFRQVSYYCDGFVVIAIGESIMTFRFEIEGMFPEPFPVG